MTNERGRAAPERAAPDVRAKSRFTVTMNLDLAEDEIDAIKTDPGDDRGLALAHPGRHRHRGDGALRPLTATRDGGEGGFRSPLPGLITAFRQPNGVRFPE